MRISEALTWARAQLKDVCERPQFEAELLLAHHLQKERTYLLIHDQEEIVNRDGFEVLIQRRAMHEPYEYIVGEASFYDLHLEVESGVLIPRPETELLIDKVAKIIKQEQIRSIAEIGVGSGAISIVLARLFPQLRIIATDICDTPLRVSRKNISRFDLQERIDVRKSHLIDVLSEDVRLVVSNPPYIAKDATLESNVVDYEPSEALFGGERGDELLKEIIVTVHARGIQFLACEMGYDQKASIQAFVKDIGVKSIEFYKDLAGFDRGFVIEFR